VSDDGADRHPRDRLKRELSLTDATLLCVASVIGSGIFLTPGDIANKLPSIELIFVAWAAGGLLSLAGALANAELGAMFPHAGGDYVYLREAYHPVAGFLVGWLTFFVIFAGTAATLAAGFADGLGGFFSLGPTGALVVAVALILGSSALNQLGVRAGARFNNIATGFKIVALLAFVGAGLAFGTGNLSHLTATDPSFEGMSSTDLATGFGRALSPILFSYLGWNATVYVASEIRSPGRNLPRSLLLGLAACTVVYLVMNLVYLYALPVAQLRHEINVGEATARALFGPVGGRLVAFFVLVSILGTLNATILVGPRIAYAMALDGRFFGGTDRVHAAYRTPHVAIWAQAAAAIALLLTLRTFPRVLDYTTFAIVLATMADTSALYALRRRRPDLPRPYVAWGYPWVPALYIAANLAIAAVMMTARPFECAVALVVAASGVPFYLAFRGQAARQAAARPDA
jgi:APA family basic amino acid/polyamine antiporter